MYLAQGCPGAGRGQKRRRLLLVPAFWGAVSIVAMWLAVLFDGIFGGDMVFSNPSSGPTTIPSAVAVALFAFIGTTVVAKRAFTRRDLD